MRLLLLAVLLPLLSLAEDRLVNPKTMDVAAIVSSLRVTDGRAMMPAQNSGASSNQPAAQPAKTGAAPAPKKHSETKTWLWVIGGISAAALAIGLTAAAQGKSPF